LNGFHGKTDIPKPMKKEIVVFYPSSLLPDFLQIIALFHYEWNPFIGQPNPKFSRFFGDYHQKQQGITIISPSFIPKV